MLLLHHITHLRHARIELHDFDASTQETNGQILSVGRESAGPYFVIFLGNVHNPDGLHKGTEAQRHTHKHMLSSRGETSGLWMQTRLHWLFQNKLAWWVEGSDCPSLVSVLNAIPERLHCQSAYTIRGSHAIPERLYCQSMTCKSRAPVLSEHDIQVQGACTVSTLRHCSGGLQSTHGNRQVARSSHAPFL